MLVPEGAELYAVDPHDREGRHRAELEDVETRCQHERIDSVLSLAGLARLRVAGQDLVVWRAPDGEVGVLLDQCPHRGVSLALGTARPGTVAAEPSGGMVGTGRIPAKAGVTGTAGAGAGAAEGGGSVPGLPT